jgi:hypothetical protein
MAWTRNPPSALAVTVTVPGVSVMALARVVMAISDLKLNDMGIDHLMHFGMKHQIQDMKIGFDDFRNQPGGISAEPQKHSGILKRGSGKQKIVKKPGHRQAGQQPQSDQQRFEMAGQNDPGDKHEHKGDHKRKKTALFFFIFFSVHHLSPLFECLSMVLNSFSHVPVRRRNFPRKTGGQPPYFSTP